MLPIGTRKGVCSSVRSRATWNHEALSNGLAMTSGQPLPEEQAEPFAQRPRPDPEIAATIDLDLGHAFHARPEHRLTPARKFGLDPEQVLSIDVGRYRRDPPDGERHRVAGKASRSETALLAGKSEEHTSELQSLMRISYAVFCLKKKKEI